jgi:hypothetical protein
MCARYRKLVGSGKPANVVTAATYGFLPPRFFNQVLEAFADWYRTRRRAVGTGMAAAVNLTPTYPLQFAGYIFPGYTALYTVILNIVVAIVLTPIFNAIGARRTRLDETVASDYHA